uniref:Retinoblastoma-associated protein B-box domain-containing protein n=1 Tax=Romanomermis culicivorax TaxID=13658 RepID=A0A915JY07_ROMCU
MMKGRHVDQLLMCSLYIISKVTKCDISFHDVMSNYRQQPQAKSRVYRNVLLGSKPNTPTLDAETCTTESNSSNSSSSSPLPDNAPNINQSSSLPSTSIPPSTVDVVCDQQQQQKIKLRSGSTLPIPAVSSAPPTPTPFEEERGDLIKFYNAIFVVKVEEFAKKFQFNVSNDGDSSDLKKSSVPLSPLPPIKQHMNLSPRKRVVDSIFVSPMKTSAVSTFLQSPARPMRYCFSRSPAKDLRAINNMLRSGESVRTIQFGVNSVR